MQLEYTNEPAIGVPGQIARGSDFNDIWTGVQLQDGIAGVGLITFAGVWAPADTQTTTLNGVPVVATMIAGDDTVAEARDRALAALNANANMTRQAIFAAVSTDQIRVTMREVSEGSGIYYPLGLSSAESTAGSGTAVASTTF